MEERIEPWDVLQVVDEEVTVRHPGHEGEQAERAWIVANGPSLAGRLVAVPAGKLLEDSDRT